MAHTYLGLYYLLEGSFYFKFIKVSDLRLRSVLYWDGVFLFIIVPFILICISLSGVLLYEKCFKNTFEFEF